MPTFSQGHSCRITLRVSPRASTSQVMGFDAGGVLKVRVTAAPVDGAANQAVVEVMAAMLGVPKSRIRVIGGLTSRNKIVEIDGVSDFDARSRLTAAS